jgi:hypothetical protein
MRNRQALASRGALKRDEALPIALDTARLVCLSGSQKGKHFPISSIGLFVGRGPDCDIVIEDNRVSSHHAWIGVVKGRLELHDLHSTNGTYLNEHIDTSVTEVELRANDTIFFGGHKAPSVPLDGGLSIGMSGRRTCLRCQTSAPASGRSGLLA